MKQTNIAKVQFKAAYGLVRAAAKADEHETPFFESLPTLPLEEEAARCYRQRQYRFQSPNPFLVFPGEITHAWACGMQAEEAVEILSAVGFDHRVEFVRDVFVVLENNYQQSL